MNGYLSVDVQRITDVHGHRHLYSGTSPLMTGGNFE